MKKEATTCISNENSNDILEILSTALHDLEKYENDNLSDIEFYDFFEDCDNFDDIKESDNNTHSFSLDSSLDNSSLNNSEIFDDNLQDDDFENQFMEDVYDEIDYLENEYFISLRQEKETLIH